MGKKNTVLAELLQNSKDDKNQFLNYFSQRVINGEASLFLGSGVSRDSGYPSWSGLLHPCFEELRLDVNEPVDLYSVAQYYANRYGDAVLRQRFSDEINRNSKSNELLERLLDISYNSIWTTNYDKLIEQSLKNRFIDCNPISHDKSLPSISKGTRINVYKMNGDISDPSNMVVTKRDYEQYRQKHPLFLTFLKKELVANTFLFAGYSFADSQVLDCLNSLNQFLGENGNHHYAFMLVDDKVTRQTQYFFEDLHKRYNIKCLPFKKEEMTAFVSQISKKIREKKVFISGAYDSIPKDEADFADVVCSMLVRQLYDKQYRIATGVGKKLGTLITGYAHQYLAENSVADPSRQLSMRPFPFHLDLTREVKERYRSMMMADCSAVIFMFGQSRTTENAGGVAVTSHYSEGVYMEFTLARKLGLAVIPIGSTGYESEIIWQEVANNINEFFYLSKKIDKLRSEKDPKKLTQLILAILGDIPKKNRID